MSWTLSRAAVDSEPIYDLISVQWRGFSVKLRGATAGGQLAESQEEQEAAMMMLVAPLELDTVRSCRGVVYIYMPRMSIVLLVRRIFIASLSAGRFQGQGFAMFVFCMQNVDEGWFSPNVKDSRVLSTSSAGMSTCDAGIYVCVVEQKVHQCVLPARFLPEFALPQYRVDGRLSSLRLTGSFVAALEIQNIPGWRREVLGLL